MSKLALGAQIPPRGDCSSTLPRIVNKKGLHELLTGIPVWPIDRQELLRVLALRPFYLRERRVAYQDQ